MSADPADGAGQAGPDDLDRLRSAVADPHTFYLQRLHALPETGGPRGYLHDRCPDPQLAAAWQLGYAPTGWTHLVDHVHTRGHTDRELLDAGPALQTRRGTVVDRFRDRRLAPYHDEHGRSGSSDGPRRHTRPC